MSYFLAIDLGASSGRHILGRYRVGSLHTEVIHSFKNEIIHASDDTMCWDIDHLFTEITAGIKKCATMGKIPETIAIDSFGVDFVLLDAENQRVGNAVSYRDGRTRGMEQIAFEKMEEAEMYRRTGIISHNFNTIYQLLALQKQNPHFLDRADRLLMIPEYFNFMLTGVKMSEYTNSSTTGLLNSETKDWDDAIINAMGLPRRIFGNICSPGSIVGEFSPDIAKQVGFSAKIVLCPSHDTASAVAATPFDAAKKDISLFLSSGTWSLLGAEINKPNVTEAARKLGFSNEGGYGGSTRFLKNIMGMWMLQSIKKELGDRHSFPELDEMAQAAKIESIVNCTDQRFFAPSSMMAEITGFCENSGQQVPVTPGEFARVIYKSLAACYHKAIGEIEGLFGKTVEYVHIIGGGSQSKFLNALTADVTGKEIVAGPIEATAMGNIAVQMIAAGVFQNLAEARYCIRGGGL
jgi:rhamnulokinase